MKKTLLLISLMVGGALGADKGTTLTDLQSAQMQISIYKEQVQSLSAQVQMLKDQVDRLQSQLLSKTSESVKTEQLTLAAKICKEDGVADGECNKWMNAQLTKIFNNPSK